MIQTSKNRNREIPKNLTSHIAAPIGPRPMLGRAQRARRDLRGGLARRHAEVQLGLVKRDRQLLGGGDRGEDNDDHRKWSFRGIFLIFRSTVGRPQHGRFLEGLGSGRSADITCASATSSSPTTSSGYCARGDDAPVIQVALKVSCPQGSIEFQVC